MNKIFIYLILVVLTSSCGDTTKPTSEKTKPFVLKKPKYYFGDSILTYSFRNQSDITYQEELETIENFQKIKSETKQDTTYIYVYKNLVASLYNGACEIKNDSLYVNIWVDSSNCISAMVHSKLTYKIKANKNINLDKIKVNVIRTNSPMMKECE